MSAAASRAQWLEERKSYLGGSEVAAIVGLNPYESPLSIYLSKTGGEISESGVKAEMGSYLEPLVKSMFTRETGLKVHECVQHVTHKEYPFLGGNPDGIVGAPEDRGDEEGLIECKTYDWSTQDEWGTPGTDEIPKAYYCQCTWYLGLTQESLCYVAALHRTTGKFSIYKVRFDPELFALLVEKAVEFWTLHVMAGIEPPPQGEDLDYLKNKYPTDTGGWLPADSEIEDFAEAMRNLTIEIKPLKKQLDDVKAKFIGRMGDNSICTTMLGDFTYRKAKDTIGVNWQVVTGMVASELQTVLAAMSIINPDHGFKSAKDTLEGFINSNEIVTRKGGRRFLTPFSKEDKTDGN